MKIVSKSEKDTELAGVSFGKTLRPGDVVALYGGLGAGKTAFVRGVARALNCAERVSSPTFTIVNEYHGDMMLFHFDMYRLKDSEELFEIGWEDYLDRGGVCAVEWSENVEDAFFPETLRVKIEKTCENERVIELPDIGGREA